MCRLMCADPSCVQPKSELRSKLGLGKVPRSALKGVPSMSLPNDAGTGEDVNYVFAHPTKQFRELKLTVSLVDGQ